MTDTTVLSRGTWNTRRVGKWMVRGSWWKTLNIRRLLKELLFWVRSRVRRRYRETMVITRYKWHCDRKHAFQSHDRQALL